MPREHQSRGNGVPILMHDPEYLIAIQPDRFDALDDDSLLRYLTDTAAKRRDLAAPRALADDRAEVSLAGFGGQGQHVAERGARDRDPGCACRRGQLDRRAGAGGARAPRLHCRMASVAGPTVIAIAVTVRARCTSRPRMRLVASAR